MLRTTHPNPSLLKQVCLQSMGTKSPEQPWQKPSPTDASCLLGAREFDHLAPGFCMPNLRLSLIARRSE